MDETLRKTGIAILGDAPWGTHFCQFYRTPEDLADILVSYFRAGLENNEYCMWVTAEPLDARHAEAAIRQAVPDFDRYVERGQIEILRHDEWYLQGGSFDRQRVLDGWVAKLQAAIARGFDGLRLTGNTFWLEQGAWDNFTEYEAMINGVIGQYRMIALCSYSLDRCSISEVLDVVSNHQFALVKESSKWRLIESSDRRQALDEIKRLNTDLERRAIALEEANKELEAFTYSISHDLRTPLHAIHNFATLLHGEFNGSLPPDAKRYADLISGNAEEMITLVNDLLNLSRYDRQPLMKQEVDLDKLVRQVIGELCTDSIRAVAIEVGNLGTSYADPVLLKQVYVNLISNALKFTRTRANARIEIGAVTGDAGQGTREGTRETATLQPPPPPVTHQGGDPGRRHLSPTTYFVRDNGVGFDIQQAERLFGVFQRFHSAEEYEGTGVGLAIVQRIIRRHGGRVWAEAQVDQGATFYFTLPDDRAA